MLYAILQGLFKKLVVFFTKHPPQLHSTKMKKKNYFCNTTHGLQQVCHKKIDKNPG